MSDNLPPGWAYASLRDLAANERGAITDGPFGSKLKTEHYTDRGPRVIRLQNIGDGVFQDAKAHISPKHFASLTKHEVIEGDLVIAALGEVLPRSCIIPAYLGPAIVKADCLRLRPHPQLVGSSFLNYALNSEVLRKQAEAIVHGVGRPRLNMGEMTSLTVPLAPPREQQRIVAALDERLSELDASVASLERAERNLVRYRAAVLAAACSGKLVPTEADLARRAGRSYEPADQLLARILAERRKANTKATYSEPAQPDTSKLPKLPEGWAWANIDQMTQVVTKGSSPNWQGFEYCDQGIVFVRSENVRWGHLDLSEVTHLPPAFNGKETKSVLKAGDLLLNIVGASIGRAAVATEAVSGGNVNQAVAVIRLVLQGPMIQFVLRWLLAADCQRYINSNKVDVARANLSLEQIRNMPFPLPPLAEQERIVAEVDRHLSRTDALAASIAQSKRRAQRLRRAILAAAFQGRLVPQDPNDEPASVLLDRIRAQAATAEAATASVPRRGRPPAQPVAPVASASPPAMTPKRRGRPPGSKNKAKA